MTTPSKDLAARVAAGGTALDKKGDTIFDLIERQKPQIARALGKAMDPDRFTRIILTEIRRVPQLAECTPESLLGAMMLSAQLGLEPGGPLGLCYFLPFNNSKTGKKEGQLSIGYKGYVTLGWESSNLIIEAYEIFENDKFSFTVGVGLPEHTFDILKPRGEIIGVWVKVTYPNGLARFRPVQKAEIEEHRKKSQQPDGPAWKHSYGQMACKTGIRIIASQLPLSPLMRKAMLADEATTVAQVKADGVALNATVEYEDHEEVIDVSSDELDEQFQTAMEGDD